MCSKRTEDTEDTRTKRTQFYKINIFSHEFMSFPTNFGVQNRAKIPETRELEINNVWSCFVNL